MGLPSLVRVVHVWKRKRFDPARQAGGFNGVKGNPPVAIS